MSPSNGADDSGTPASDAEGSSDVRLVLWDIGNVLLHWDPRLLYRTVFDDPDEMEWFLGAVWTPLHNLRCDAGETFADVIEEAIEAHPALEAQVRAIGERWIETIGGPVHGMSGLLSDVSGAGVSQWGLTNFSAETFPLVAEEPVLSRLDDIVVSGRERLVKPDQRIYRLALERAGFEPYAAVFFDDSPANVEGARAVGIDAVLFVDAEHARTELVRRDVAVAPEVTSGH